MEVVLPILQVVVALGPVRLQVTHLVLVVVDEDFDLLRLQFSLLVELVVSHTLAHLEQSLGIVL